MNNDMQKTMQFIAEKQAQTSIQIEKNSLQIEKNSLQIEKNAILIEENSIQIKEHSAQIGQLKDLLFRTLRIVEEQGRQTDDRINALIAVVERHFSNGQK